MGKKSRHSDDTEAPPTSAPANPNRCRGEASRRQPEGNTQGFPSPCFPQPPLLQKLGLGLEFILDNTRSISLSSLTHILMSIQDNQICLFLQEIRQHLDGTPEDVRLYELISNFCQQPRGSLKWRRSFIPLLKEIQRLPGLAKPKPGYEHENYPDVLHDTLIQVRDSIYPEFQPIHPTLKGSLVGWINEKLRLKYKVIELFSPKKHAEVSLDNPINSEENGETFLDNLADRTIEGIYGIIEAEDRSESQRIDRELRDYIENDPEGILQNCHPRSYPKCNCQELFKKRILKTPPEKWDQISKELNVPIGTVTAHWHRKCQPILNQLPEKVGYQGK